MIKKLEPIKAFDCSDTPQAKMQHHNYHNDCINKINELVDAVNGILLMQEQYATIYNEDIVPMLTPENSQSSKMEQDRFAEQRRWIGKLCKVYDDNDFVHYAVLEKIWNNSDYCYGTLIGDYKHCEPVKPDDDIIYKGGDNE